MTSTIHNRCPSDTSPSVRPVHSHLTIAVNTPEQYLKISRKLGNVLADGGHMTVNGAGRVRYFRILHWIALFL